jgi:hypothetical protein
LLITRLGVQTGRLLGSLHGDGKTDKDTDIELHMHAFVKVTKGTVENLDFL